MKRVFVIATLALIFQASWQSLAIYLPSWANLFFIPPVILVFSLQFFRPLQTIFSCLLCGLFADILGGLMIGTNMLFMLFFAFILSAFNIISGRIHKEEQFYYTVAISFLYRVMMLAVHFIFLKAKANIFFLSLLLGPLVDGLMSIVFYYLLMKILVFTKAIEQSDSFKSKFGFYR